MTNVVAFHYNSCMDLITHHIDAPFCANCEAREGRMSNLFFRNKKAFFDFESDSSINNEGGDV